MILYNEIFPEGDITKGIYVGQNEVKFVNIGDKLVYDTFSHVTYDDPIIDISYPVMSRGGRSGTQWVSPTITYQQTVHTWGHSGNYYGSVIEEGSVSDFTVEGAILNSSEAWIDEDGIVYRESLNTTYKPSTWNIMEVTISAKINGKSSSSSVTVQMESNTRTKYGGITTYGSITAGNITNTVIPAKGTQGTYYTAIAEKGSQSYNISRQYYLYQTGAEETIFDASSGSINIDPVDEYGNICSSISINNCDSKGTNISAKNIVLAQTVYWNSINSSDYKSGTMIIYQDVNKVTNLTIGHSSNYHCSYPIFDAAGDTNTPSGNVYFILTYSSTDTYKDNGTMCYYRRTYKDNNNSDVFTLNNSNSGSISVPPNYSTSEKSGTISSTLYAEYTNPAIVGSNTVSETLTHDIPLTQEGDYQIGSDYEYRISIKADKYYNSNQACPASGDSVKLTVTPQYRRITYWRSGDITNGSWTTGNQNEVSITSTNSSFILSGTTITIPENTETQRQSTYTATYHKKTASVTIYQSGDTIDYYNTPTFDMWWSSGAGNNGTPVSAAGGKSASPTYSVSQTATYVSGTVRSVTPNITSAVFSLNANTTVSTVSVNSSTGVVTFGSAGTNLQNKEHAEILLTVVSHGKTGTDIGWCYQDANIKTNTYGTPSLSLRYTPGEYNNHKDYTAGVSTPTYSFSQSVTSEYSSGKITTSTITSGATWEFSTTASSTVATINSSTGVVTWPINNGTSSRQILVTAKCISNGISNTTQTYLYQDGVNTKSYYGKVQWTNNSWNSKGTIIDAIYSIGRGLNTDFTSDFSWIFSGTSGSQLITVNDCFEPPVHIIKSGTYRNTSYSANFEPSTFTFTSMDKNNPTIINLIIR